MSMSVSKILGLDKVKFFFDAIKQTGGFRMAAYRLYRENELKYGKLIGEDQFGNKYYENPYYFMGRNRWVIYNPSFGIDFDASMVTPGWYGWLHHKRDLPPTEAPPVKYDWMAQTPTYNFSGSNLAYMPYSTTTPKVKSWQPPKKA